MKKIMKFQNHTLYRTRKGIVDRGKARLPFLTTFPIDTWVSKDFTIGYEETSEPLVHYNFQRLSYKEKQGRYHIFTISCQGLGNIPWQHSLAVHELVAFVPDALKKNRKTYGVVFDEQKLMLDLPIERSEAYLYPWEKDEKHRVTKVTAISRDRAENGKQTFNAFDLNLKYKGDDKIPTKIVMSPYNLGIVRKKVPGAFLRSGSEISLVMKELLGAYGINTACIERPVCMMKRDLER